MTDRDPKAAARRAKSRWRGKVHQTVVYLSPDDRARLDALREPGEGRGTCIKRLIAEAYAIRPADPA